MTLFNTAACGPSTALSKLGNFPSDQNGVSASHSGCKTMYQKQQNQGTIGGHQTHKFTQNHLNTVNGALENDFGSFVNASASPRMAPAPSGPFGLSAGSQGAAASMKTSNTSMQSPNWISEFSRVSVSDHAIKSQNSGYDIQNSRFRSQMATGYQGSVVGATSSTASYVGFAGTNPVYSRNFHLRSQIPVHSGLTEHQQLHREELQEPQVSQENGITEDELFTQAFDMIEQELDSEIAEDPVATGREDPNDLSNIAASISATLQNISNSTDNQLMQDKITNSTFLKLMQDISAKQVSLGEKGFVSVETGKYIGSNADESNKEVANLENEDSNNQIPLDQTNHLPDPLSFVKSTDNLENSTSDQLRNLLNSRFNGDNILPKNYDDILDDYRVDE